MKKDETPLAPEPIADPEIGRITTSLSNNIFYIGIDRPTKLNGFTPEMFMQIAEAFTEYENNNYPLKRHRYLEKRNKFAWWIGIIYIYAMIDAVVDAHLHSFDQLMDSPLKQKVNEEIDYEK